MHFFGLQINSSELLLHVGAMVVRDVQRRPGLDYFESLSSALSKLALNGVQVVKMAAAWLYIGTSKVHFHL